MKKILTVLTIVALVASSAFAGFSGEASVTAGANLDNGNFGFLDNGNNVKLSVDLSTAEGSAQGEGDIYASIKASLAITVRNGEKGTGFSGNPQDVVSWGVVAKLEEAKIAGENWYVSITGMPDGPDYASSAIDTYKVKGQNDKWGLAKADYSKNASVGVPYASTNGVEVGVMGFKAGVGLLGDYNKGDAWKLEDNLNVAAFIETPEFDFSGVKLQDAGVYSYNSLKGISDGVAVPATEKQNALGGSVKVGFENDTLSASIAADMGVKFPVVDGGEAKFDADVAANFNYDFITVDAYYGTNPVTGEKPVGQYKTDTEKSYTKNLLSAQAKFDLNSFDVPVAFTVSAKNLLHTVDLGVSAEVTVLEGLKLTANAGYVVSTIGVADADKIAFVKSMDDVPAGITDDVALEAFDYFTDGVFLGQWSAGLDAEYAFDFATVKGGVSLKNVGLADAYANQDQFRDTEMEDTNEAVNKVLLGASASIETTTLIPGATLTLAWDGADDLLRVYNKTANGDFKNFGSITAKCTIAF